MPAGWLPNGKTIPPLALRHPDSFFLAAGFSPEECFGAPTGTLKRCPGMAWAARRELIERHRLYDACIVGGGDGAFVRAAYGRIDDAMRIQAMGRAKREHYVAWAQPFHDAVRGEVVFVEGDLFHLWHGRPEDRRYEQRHRGLEMFDFDPFEDIAEEPSGVWRWASQKPGMHRYVSDYFVARREDG
jgi:hypothetical protein